MRHGRRLWCGVEDTRHPRVTDEQAGTNSPVTPWMLLAFFVGFPVGVYLGCALVAGLVGAVLVRLGQLSVSEAIWYALLSRYPSRWMKGKR